jgi:hypothetical protein
MEAVMLARQSVFAALVMLTLASASGEAVADNQPPADRDQPAPSSPKTQPKAPPTDHGSAGVIPPPNTGDDGVVKPPPQGTADPMPVIPPPGGAGGNVQPK